MNVFDLYAKISLDSSDYEKELNSAKGKFSGFADGIKGAAGKLGDVLAGIGKTAAVGIGAAGTALTALTKQTLDAVGSFEQLEGGAQKIFDEMDFEKISKDAKNAYKELNMSAAQYLEAINLAGATFAQTMGDEKGYDTARKGMLAIADYASGTGRNLEELNQKYQMITRATSSYQSIADQFSGILPATSADFLEQAQAAGYLADTYEKLTEVPVAEYQQALTNMLERGVKNLGLSNNTLRESTETLTGSFAMAKAAWQNFLTGQGTVGDFTGALTSAIEQTKKKLNVIIPRLTEGLTELIDQLAPELPLIIEDTLPAIITGASSLLTGLANRLPQLITTILPALSKGVVDVSVALVGVMPELVSSLAQSIPIVVRTIMSKKDELLKAGKDMIAALTPKDFKGLVNQGSEAVKSFIDGALSPDSINNLLDGAGKIIENLVDGIKTVLLGSEQDGEGGIFGAAKEIIIKIGDYFSDDKNRQNFIENADKIIYGLGKAIISVLQNGVAPLMVEAARTWMEVFIGEINYTDAANDIIKRLGEAFLHNMMTGGILGQWIDSAAEDYLNEEVDPNIGYQPSTDYYTTEGMIAAGALQGAALNAYNSSRGYNSFYSDVPRAITNNSSIGDNVTNITINATSDRAEDIRDAVVSAMDEKLAQRQALQNRGYGYVGR